jgi:hypothetical protein
MMDGGSLLKPALSRGELRCIGESISGWVGLPARTLMVHFWVSNHHNGSVPPGSLLPCAQKWMEGSMPDV